MESMKDGSASCIFIKNLHVFMCRLWNLNGLLDFFKNSNVIFWCQIKNCVLIFKEMDLHVTSPTRDHFFISRRACDNVSLHIFDFLFFSFKNCFCNLHSIQKFVVRASVARGQGSGLSAQKRFCLCLACFALPSLKTICFLVSSPAGDQIFCHQKSLQSCHTWPFSFHSLIFLEIAASKIFKNQ